MMGPISPLPPPFFKKSDENNMEKSIDFPRCIMAVPFLYIYLYLYFP